MIRFECQTLYVQRGTMMNLIRDLWRPERIVALGCKKDSIVKFDGVCAYNPDKEDRREYYWLCYFQGEESAKKFKEKVDPAQIGEWMDLLGEHEEDLVWYPVDYKEELDG